MQNENQQVQSEMHMLVNASEETILRRWWQYVHMQTTCRPTLRLLWVEYTTKYPRGETKRQAGFTGTSPGRDYTLEYDDETGERADREQARPVVGANASANACI